MGQVESGTAGLWGESARESCGEGGVYERFLSETGGVWRSFLRYATKEPTLLSQVSAHTSS